MSELDKWFYSFRPESTQGTPVDSESQIMRHVWTPQPPMMEDDEDEDVLVLGDMPGERLTATFHELLVELNWEIAGANARTITIFMAAAEMHKLVDEWQRRYDADAEARQRRIEDRRRSE